MISKKSLSIILVGILLGGVSLYFTNQAKQSAYKEEVMAWQQEHKNKIYTNYVTATDLFYAQENTSYLLGKHSKNDFRLSEEDAPDFFGQISYKADTITFKAPNNDFMYRSEPILNSLSLKLPDINTYHEFEGIYYKNFKMSLVWKPELKFLTVVIRNTNNVTPVAKRNTVSFFPINAKYKVRADFIPANKAIQFNRHNVDFKVSLPSPAKIRFVLDTKRYELDVYTQEQGGYFLAFGDSTNSKTTYKRGRHLYLPNPDKNGKVWVDFNKANNPGCVYSDNYNCALASEENTLAIAIPAGEKKYKTPTASTIHKEKKLALYQ